MTESTKIDFRHRRVAQLEDLADLVEMLFPGNPNQQHAAARILLLLKSAARHVPVRSLSGVQEQHGISRRTLQRTRAKLSRLGLIERISWMNSRFGGQEGWRLSSRFSSALRRLAETVDTWKDDDRTARMEKDAAVVGLLTPHYPLFEASGLARGTVARPGLRSPKLW